MNLDVKHKFKQTENKILTWTLRLNSNKLKIKCILVAFINTEPMNENYDSVAQ